MSSDKAEKMYLTEEEAAKRYCYSRSWFQKRRGLGIGPQFVKINGGKILYPIDQTDQWFESKLVKTNKSGE